MSADREQVRRDAENWVAADDALLLAGEELEAQVQKTLAALEQKGLSPREADEFIRDCVFTAWWDWDYEPAVVVR